MTKDDSSEHKALVEAVAKIDKVLAEPEGPSRKDYREAVLKAFDVLVEAIAQTPEQFKARHPWVHWDEIAFVRNWRVRDPWAFVEYLLDHDLPMLRKVLDVTLSGRSFPLSSMLDDTYPRQYPTCSAWMPIARCCCVLAPGHSGNHRSKFPPDPMRPGGPWWQRLLAEPRVRRA